MPVATDPAREVAAAIDTLSKVDPVVLGDGETVLALHRQRERLDAITTRATAAFDASGEWQAAGARSAAAWLTAFSHLPSGTCRREVSLGRALRHMDRVEEAWLAGDIGQAHVALLARARTPVTENDFDRDEKSLVDDAMRLRFSSFARVLAYWMYHADPDGAEDEAARQRERRRLHLSQSFEGLWFLNGILDPIQGAIVAKALTRIEKELFDADWAEAKKRLGRDPKVGELGRTPAQRRADALAEMTRRAFTAPADGRRPEPLFSVLVGYETFAGMCCELASHTMVTPGSLLAWLNEAWVERVVFESPSRVIDVGELRRLFTGATRRAVELAGKTCFHPTCEVPAEDCQIDHVVPHSAGGPTTQDNGRPACDFHNRERHRRT